MKREAAAAQAGIDAMTSITLADLVTPERVIPSLRARDVQQVICEMTRIAAQAAFLDHPSVQDAVLARGESSSFGFGRGVALPHAMVAGLSQPLGVFARLSSAQDFGAADDMPVDLVLLLLSPEGDEAMLLRTLACAARRLRDGDVASRVRSADSAEAIHIVLTSDSWRGPTIRMHVSGSAHRGASPQ